MFNAVFREGGRCGSLAVGKLPAGLAGTFDVALAGDMVRAADMVRAVDMVRAAVWLVAGRCRAVARGAARWGRAAAESWEHWGE